MSIIEDLELSVRTSNVLRDMGTVHTLEDFLALEKDVVLMRRNAGRRTWQEIASMQNRLATERKQVLEAKRQRALAEVSLRDAAALAALPALIARHRADVAWSMIAPLAFEIADDFIAARERKA